MEEGTAVEEGKDVSGERETEAEYLLQKVGCVATSVCLTCVQCQKLQGVICLPQENLLRGSRGICIG